MRGRCRSGSGPDAAPPARLRRRFPSGKMPGVLPSESGAASRGSPSKRSRLSLKLFQKKEAKRALDFAEPQDGGGSSPEPRGADVYVGEKSPGGGGCLGGCRREVPLGYLSRRRFSLCQAIKLCTKGVLLKEYRMLKVPDAGSTSAERAARCCGWIHPLASLQLAGMWDGRKKSCLSTINLLEALRCGSGVSG